MHRFWVIPNPENSREGFLSPEDTRHALSVLRLAEGDPVEALSESGRFRAEIRSVEAGRIAVSLLEALPDPEPRLKVTLYQGLPKADKMEWIVQKAVELGVSRIVPVMMTRSVSRPDSRDRLKKRERWQKIAREACKQSGRILLPEVEPPLSVPEAADRLKGHSLSVIPWEESRDAGPLAVFSRWPSVSDLGIVIGPEGGIDRSEMDLFLAAGGVPMTLGPRILRTETAGLSVISAFMALYGEMEG
ncbi:MAG: 16S rRNA (uracil(1498)-N(3))-methyltransferase [Clostridia bacterium]|nr:16S rRNA (uracil(1498)-N(3))-methyltransferase [Clostridia bacterium]